MQRCRRHLENLRSNETLYACDQPRLWKSRDQLTSAAGTECEDTPSIVLTQHTVVAYVSLALELLRGENGRVARIRSLWETSAVRFLLGRHRHNDRLKGRREEEEGEEKQEDAASQENAGRPID